MGGILRETETIELKKTTSELKEAVISITSILNKHNFGEVYFGIRNNGEITGQEITENTIREVSKAIADYIEPKIYPKVTKVNISGRACLHVEFSGEESPYYAFGRAYIRVGDEDRQLSAKEIENMIVRKNRHHLRWDDKVSDATPKDVKQKLFKDYIKKVKAAGRVRIDTKETPKILKKLGLMKGKNLLNAASALFSGSNLLEVQFAVFAGREKLTFLDIKQAKGNIFELLEQCEEYIKDRINWRVKFGKMEREEIPEIPLDALREALLNSFCHRDYTISKSNEICIFRDRIEIYNPGSFPEGLTPKDFIKGEERSVLRNPLIAEIFYYSKDIEKFGTGLKRIHDECRDDKVRVEFKVIKTGFVTVFYRNEALEDSQKNTPQATPQVTPQATPQACLTELELKVFNKIIKNNKISRKEIAANLGIRADTVKEYLDKLKRKGILRRVGTTSKGHWEVKE